MLRVAGFPHFIRYILVFILFHLLILFGIIFFPLFCRQLRNFIVASQRFLRKSFVLPAVANYFHNTRAGQVTFI